MLQDICNTDIILLVGNEMPVHSIAVNLLVAGHTVHLCTDNRREFVSETSPHFMNMQYDSIEELENKGRLTISEEVSRDEHCGLAIVITKESLPVKSKIIQYLEERLSSETVIAINSENINLDVLQERAVSPARLIALNWVEPAHTTFFLEIISNHVTTEGVVDQLAGLARSAWGKDPYMVQHAGIRARLMSAMAREAFYLVDNGIASLEDIDRACRNDAGYYLPFSGNCRYMDLMGTSAYGVVMKDLNPDLSREQKAPVFFENIIKDGGLGMADGKGFYEYTEEDKSFWKKVTNKFSYEIQEIMTRYPFDQKLNDNSNCQP